MISFGQWLPDQPVTANKGIVQAKNCIASADGYRSFNGLSPYSGVATNKILGAFASKDFDDNNAIYAGDSGKLYKFNSTDSSLTDISKAGGYSTGTGNKWRFTQFGENVIATNYNDNIQTIVSNASGLFSDLSADAPKAKYIATIRDFVMVGNTYDAVDGNVSNRVRWSALGNDTSWAVSATTLSDFQDLYGYGKVQGIVGGEYGTILCERGIFRCTFVGSPLVWQFDAVETQRGCAVDGSVTAIGNAVFYLSDDGFYMFDGNSSKNIGAERVNRWFLEQFNIAYKEDLTCASDPQNQIVMWSFTSNDSTTNTPDKILVYNYAVDKWSYLELACDLLVPLFSTGYTLEELDNISSSIDALPSSLDSAVYKGGSYFFGAVKDKKIQTFGGATLAGEIITSEQELSKGKHTMVNKVFPIHKGGTATVSVGSRNNTQDSVSFTTATNVNSVGFAPIRSRGKYHRAKINITGDWNELQGLDFEINQLGMR